MIEDKTSFYSTTYGTLSIPEVLSAIKNFLERDPNASYSLVIGTDSHEKLDGASGKRHINLVTAIIVYRIAFGGQYFWKTETQGNVHSLRQRSYAEALM